MEVRMMLSLPSAYTALGLDPPYEFALAQIVKNEEKLIAFELLGADEKYARIGATTWMCVHATIDIIEKKTVMVVGQNETHGVGLAKDIKGLLEKLGIPVTSGGFHASHLEFSTQGKLLPGLSERTYKRALRKFPEAETYRDAIWKNDLISHLKDGPMGTIAFVKSPDGYRWEGFDESHGLVMALTREGVSQLLRDLSGPFPINQLVRVRRGLF